MIDRLKKMRWMCFTDDESEEEHEEEEAAAEEAYGPEEKKA